MERQSLILSATLLVLLVLTGFYAGFLMDRSQEKTRPMKLNFEANSSEDIVEASFNGTSIQLMYEDRNESRMYLDLDMDGSADREIDVVHDGREHNTTELVEAGNRTYTLFITYRDNGSVAGDGEMVLTKARPE
ncbi:MAG: hypothetical protein ABEJ03_04350 [Candidatus Nanohaloarchaea archaeon]